MTSIAPRGIATVAQLAEFDAILDARSPGEFAEDRLPGALSMPVLSNAERIEIGTLYKQVSAFEAKKRGAVRVARNVAQHIETHFLDKPKNWRPLVYCWRGGQRSGAFAHILREIGWDAHRLQGGYKTWRRHVVEALTVLPEKFRFRVIAGATGSGKSRLLEALSSQGAQVLHLENLAAHKGSVLGNLPDQNQPSQKSFESSLFAALNRLDPARPVFVEAESRRIGLIQVPSVLIDAIRAAPCVRIEASVAARVQFLLQDYDYAIADPVWLTERIEHLKKLQSKETLAHWHTLIQAGDFAALVKELLTHHYDPLYQRSQTLNFNALTGAEPFSVSDLSPTTLNSLARQLLSYP